MSATTATADARGMINATALTGSVDVFDVAARLEANGYGVSTSLRAGYTSTFEHARALMPRESHHERTKPTSDVKIHGGWARTVVLVSGVAMCLLMLGAPTPLQLFLAAGATWSVSQVMSAILWTGVGRGETPLAARIAVVTSVVALTLAGLLGVLAGWTILGWAAWGIVAAVGNSLFAGRRFAQLCAVGALVPLGFYFWNPTAGRVAAAVAVSAFLVWALRTLSRLAASSARMDEGLTRATVLALVQSLSLQAGLVGLYLLHHESFSVLALAGFLLAVLLETSLDYVTGLARTVAAHTTSWRRARASITWITVAATTAGGAAGAVLCFVLGDVLDVGGQLARGTYQAALVLGVLMTASGLLLRCGSASGAAVVSAAGAVLMLMGQVLTHSPLEVTASIVVAAGFCVATAMVAARHVAAPRNW